MDTGGEKIKKTAGIIVRDNKLLITRTRGKDFFVSPGGKMEQGESPKEALIRELMEELSIKVFEEDLEEFGNFSAEALGESKELFMEVFVVKRFDGEIKPSGEVEELAWVGENIPEGMELGSIFAHEVLPRLVAQGVVK